MAKRSKLLKQEPQFQLNNNKQQQKTIKKNKQSDLVLVKPQKAAKRKSENPELIRNPMKKFKSSIESDGTLMLGFL